MENQQYAAKIVICLSLLMVALMLAPRAGFILISAFSLLLALLCCMQIDPKKLPISAVLSIEVRPSFETVCSTTGPFEDNQSFIKHA